MLQRRRIVAFSDRRDLQFVLAVGQRRQRKLAVGIRDRLASNLIGHGVAIQELIRLFAVAAAAGLDSSRRRTGSTVYVEHASANRGAALHGESFPSRRVGRAMRRACGE